VRGVATTETLKEKALTALAKRLEDGRVYRYTTIKKLLLSLGMSIPYANRIIEELEWYGVLERVGRGEYKYYRLRMKRAYGV
jgi:DNA-binding Lrp family transcriptional regulator